MTTSMNVISNENIVKIVEKRKFVLLFSDESSGLLFNIRRIIGVKQFTRVDDENWVELHKNLCSGHQYKFDSSKVIFKTGGSYKYCTYYFDFYTNMYFKYGAS